MTDPALPRDDDPDTTPLASGSPVPPSGDPAGTPDDSAAVSPAGPQPSTPASTSTGTSRLAGLRARRVSLGVVLAALLVGGVLGAGAMAVAGHGDPGSHRFADQQGRNGGPSGSGLPGYGGRNDGGQFGGPGMGGPGMNRRGDGNGFPGGQQVPGNQGNGPAPVPSASPSTAPSTSSST